MDSQEWGDAASRNSNDDFNRRRSEVDSGPYDNRRNRNRDRSRSPHHIDRYQPERNGRERGNFYRGREENDRRRRSPPHNQAGIDRYVPGHDQGPPPLLLNPLQNPMTLPYQVGFTWFAEWWRTDKQIREEKERAKSGARRPIRNEKEMAEERAREREQIQAAYDGYKEKLSVQMARNFVHEHKAEEWFKERYDPETRDPLRAQQGSFRTAALAKWEADLKSGIFDEFTLEGIYKNDSNGAGGVVEKEEGEAAAANEVLGVSDLLPTRGGDLRDEAALQPTLLIKTIAPTVSRSKMEAFCKEHLGESDGGFRWLSLSDPNPQKKYHRIGWVLLNPGGDAPQADQRADPREAQENGDENTMDVEPPSQTTTQKGLELINGKTIHDESRGDFTCHVGIHEPPMLLRKKALWDLFSAPDRIERDLELAVRLVNKYDAELSEMGHPANAVEMVDTYVEDLRGKGWLQPPVNAPSARKPVAKDADFDEDEGMVDDDEEEGAVNENDDNDDEDLLVKKKRLDLLVEYLRRVHNFCLFCVFESDSVHELARKCPGGHLRRPRSSLTSNAKIAAKASADGEAFPFKKDASARQQDSSKEEEQPGSPVEERKQFRGASKTQQQLQRAFNWVKTYEEKLLQLLDPTSVDMKKIGGKSEEEALDEELSKFYKQEDEFKFRCKVQDCTKLFKGQVFWRKHVEKRHEEFFSKTKYDVTLVTSYVLDPSHIAPSRNDATSNGHFPIKDHLTTGTPRGFNLHNFQSGIPGFPNMGAGMGAGMPPGMGAGPGNAMQFAAFMAQGMNPGMWNNNPPGVDNDHGLGPQRRGRGPVNRNPAPYDRNGGKDQRNARWNNNNGGGGPPGGRLSPPRAGLGRPTGPPRFGEGGAGPREAVQGRSIRSYEDLDAAGSGGGESLDY